jgi:GcrA cell cycle regulator
LASEGHKTHHIAEKLGRTRNAVKTRRRHHELGPLDGHSPWTAEDDKKLKQLRAEGHSFGSIANSMERSRNSCISRAHRIGVPVPPLVKRALPDRWGNNRAPHIPKQAKPQRKPVPKTNGHANGHTVTVVTLKNNPPKMLSIMELKPRHCRWPIGDPRDEKFRYCGAHKERGAYCHEHAALCYVEPNNRNGAIRAQEAVAKWAGPKRRF